MSRSQLWTSVAWVPAFMGSMLYQAIGGDATRVSFQFCVSNAPTTAWLRLTRRGRPRAWRDSGRATNPAASALGQTRAIGEWHAQNSGSHRRGGSCGLGSRGANAIRFRRVQERAADARPKTKISEMITERTPPLEGGSFPVSVDGVVPSDVQLNSLPSEAEQLAPQLRGFSYVVVEELVAIVDPRTRKVEIVFPRWGKP